MPERGLCELVDLNQIKSSPFNARKSIEGPAFDDLVASVRAKGIISPITVRPAAAEAEYELVAGERRWRAAKEVAKEKKEPFLMPVVIKTLTDEEVREIMLIENIQRQDLTEYEEALAFEQYAKKFADVKALSEKTGISIRYIRKRVNILTLPKKILDDWKEGKITYSHLEQLRRLKDSNEILSLYKEVMNIPAWNREDGKIRSASWIEHRINEKSIPLKNALFPLKPGCVSCESNTEIQADLFGIEGKLKAHCLAGSCFLNKQADWLNKNWSKTQFAQKSKAHHFVDNQAVKHGDYTYFGYGVTIEKSCLGCEKLGALMSIREPEVRTMSTICLDGKCWNTKYKKSRRATEDSPADKKSRVEKRSQEHGREFRELFFHDIIPGKVEVIDNLDPIATRLYLITLLYSNRQVQEYFYREIMGQKSKSGHSWFGLDFPGAWDFLEKEKSEKTLLGWLKKLSGEILIQFDFGSTMRFKIAPAIGIDLKKEWKITEDYLQKKTKDELISMGKKLEIFKTVEVLGYIRDKMKLKGTPETLALKKGQLIDLFLKSGADLSGKVPNEILKE